MYIFIIVADTPATATATVEITVIDVNDNVPALDRSEYSAVIRENSSPGDVIELVGMESLFL